MTITSTNSAASTNTVISPQTGGSRQAQGAAGSAEPANTASAGTQQDQVEVPDATSVLRFANATASGDATSITADSEDAARKVRLSAADVLSQGSLAASMQTSQLPDDLLKLLLS